MAVLHAFQRLRRPGRPGFAVPGEALVTGPRSERLRPTDRIRTSRDYAEVKAGGIALRGSYCLLLVLRQPEAPTRVGFITSKRSVGGAVQRNRARRRLREIVRRRWSSIAPTGFGLVFIAFRGSLSASHPDLVGDVERLLIQAQAWRPAAGH
jgi:ribonuclease P protein component